MLMGELRLLPVRGDGEGEKGHAFIGGVRRDFDTGEILVVLILFIESTSAEAMVAGCQRRRGGSASLAFRGQGALLGQEQGGVVNVTTVLQGDGTVCLEEYVEKGHQVL